MNAIRFQTVINDDQVIRPPEGVKLTPGPVEVIVLQPEAPADGTTFGGSPSQALVQRLARLAEELNLHGLPSDLAENHDHYLHGLPKGIDES